MQVDAAAGAFPLAGRRRVAHLSKDEWRQSLQQQLREKEELKHAQALAKRSAVYLTETAGNQLGEHVEALQRQSAEESLLDGATAAPRAGGRRFVRAMTADEWKASLEEQMREKERQRPQRGQTAPTETNTSPFSAPPQHAEALATAKTLPQTGDESNKVVGGRRRGVQPQQTREEFLLGLQEQIELKKKQEEANQTTTKSRARHGQRRVIEEEEEDGDGCWPPRVKPKEIIILPVPVEPPPLSGTRPSTPAPEEATAAEPATDDTIEPRDETSTLTGAPPATALVPVAMDPAALTKLLELCEGMKQQNEELKQQLQQQQSVLATLSGKTTGVEKTTTKAYASVPASTKKLDQNGVKTSVATAKRGYRKRPSTKTPQKPSAVPVIRAEKTATPSRTSKRASVEPVPLRDVHEEGDRVEDKRDCVDASTPLPKMSNQSRLAQPRVIPRLRPPQPKERLKMATVIGATDEKELSAQQIPQQEEMGTTEMTLHTNTPSVNEVIRPTPGGFLPPLVDPSQHPPPSRRESSPSIDQLRKRSRSPSHAVSLPPIALRASCTPILADMDDCLDATSPTRPTSITLLRHTSISFSHQFELDLEAQSSSVSILIGPSTMVPYKSGGEIYF